MKTGRNEPCPCGSGKKYKNCHAEKTPDRMEANRLGWIVTAIVAAGAISLFASLRGSSGDVPEPSPTAAPVAPIAATPPAPAPTPEPAAPLSDDPPPGKVWSKEHGHWHDVANPSQVQMSTTTIPINQGGQPPAAAGTPGTPQPPGPAPAGKVWSVEHGHWHDAPGAAAGADQVPAELQPYMKPPSVPAAPPGAVWSEEHQHWHKADEEAKRKGTVNPNTPATTTQEPKPENR